MAQFSGNLNAKIVSGGQGHSAVSSAAYNARCVLENERLGGRDDYSRKSDECLFSGVYAPKDAPEWTRDREQLWNHVEAFEFGKRKDAQLARAFEIPLPHELTAEQNRFALQDFIRDNFTRKGLVADLAIHAPDRHGDERNIHAHLMVTLRKLDGTEFQANKDRLSKTERDAQLDGWKRSLEHHMNRHLVRHGLEPYYDCRSNAERGVDEAGLHMGKEAAALERRGIETEPGRINREIEERNRVRAELQALLDEQQRQAANENQAAPTPLRSPEDMRRDFAERLRQPEPAQDIASKKRAADPAPEKQPEPPRAPLTRETWAALLREQNPRPEPTEPVLAPEDKGRARVVPPTQPEATQRPSYEAEKPASQSKTPEIDRPGLFGRAWSGVRDWFTRQGEDRPADPKRSPLSLDPEPKPQPRRNPLKLDPAGDRDAGGAIGDEMLAEARAKLAAKRARETLQQQLDREAREMGGRGHDGSRERHYRAEHRRRFDLFSSRYRRRHGHHHRHHWPH